LECRDIIRIYNASLLAGTKVVTKKYSEEIIRHAAITADGKPREIIERITYGREECADGSPSSREIVNRRYDLKTGECLTRLNEAEFEDGETGARFRLQGSA
jgi:hypothetical protein